MNIFALQEVDWMPGGFNSEYGDAMSALSNYHTSTGKNEYVFKTKFETSDVGALFGSEYDKLRNYNFLAGSKKFVLDLNNLKKK